MTVVGEAADPKFQAGTGRDGGERNLPRDPSISYYIMQLISVLFAIYHLSAI